MRDPGCFPPKSRIRVLYRNGKKPLYTQKIERKPKFPFDLYGDYSSRLRTAMPITPTTDTRQTASTTAL